MVINRYFPFVGGNETQCKILSEALVTKGVNVSVVTTWLYGTRLYENINGVRIFRILPPVWSKILWPTAFLSNVVLFLFLLIRKKEYDIIHAHQALWHALGVVIAGKLLNKKSVVKVAGGGPSGNIAFWQEKSITGSIAIAILKKASCVVSVSEEIAYELAHVGIQGNTVSISNGVKIEERQKDKSDFFEMQNIRNRYQKVATYIGRLSEEKGVDILLKAWKQVNKKEKQAVVVIVGDGPQREELSKFVKDNEMNGNVFFVGERKDIASYLQGSDIFILPSRGEGMSNALLEAMSCGLPCIVSRVGGNLKLIKNRETGMFFDKEDSQDLMECVIEVFHDKNLAFKLGNNAKEFIKREFSIEAIATQYSKLYHRILDQRQVV
ncbi:MAG TPA: glycosyltransferase family 4 protein [Candidatus Wunengus sp. YC64]